MGLAQRPLEPLEGSLGATLPLPLKVKIWGWPREERKEYARLPRVNNYTCRKEKCQSGSGWCLLTKQIKISKFFNRRKKIHGCGSAAIGSSWPLSWWPCGYRRWMNGCWGLVVPATVTVHLFLRFRRGQQDKHVLRVVIARRFTSSNSTLWFAA